MAREITSAQQLNKLIEMHVFGKQIAEEPYSFEGKDYVAQIIDGNTHHVPLTPYSTDLNEAWKIVEHFGLWYGFRSKSHFKTMEVSMGNDLSDGEVVTFVFIVRDGIKSLTYGGEGTTLSRAICLSALKAKGIEVENDVCENG